MPRPKSLIPKLCIDKTRNRAFCKVDGKFLVLGRAGSAEAQAAYGKLLTDLAHGDSNMAVRAAKEKRLDTPNVATTVSLTDLFLRFATMESARYSDAEQRCLKSAIRITRELYGDTPCTEFGPLRLRTVREAMIRKGWGRSFINKQIKRLRMVIRWGVGWEMVPQTVADSLTAVKCLAKGESDVPDPIPRRAIPDRDLKAVRDLLCDRHRDIMDLMLMTGCRPGEILSLTTSMIDRTGEIWRADLASHKTAHQGKSRTLFFNISAQEILLRHFKADPTARLFSLRRDTLSNAIKAACEVAFGMPAHLRKPARELTAKQKVEAKSWRRKHVWTPHWLRHTVATRLADEVGTEAAQRLLGHASRAMTEHYSKAAERVAIDAVKRLG